jgi:hypothetical protein
VDPFGWLRFLKDAGPGGAIGGIIGAILAFPFEAVASKQFPLLTDHYVNLLGMKSYDLDFFARIPYLVVGGFVGALVGAGIYALLTSGKRKSLQA